MGKISFDVVVANGVPMGLAYIALIIKVIILLGIVVLVGTILAIIVHSARTKKPKGTGNVSSTNAMVIGKRENTNSQYIVGFRLPNGMNMEFIVPQVMYGVLNPGDQGVLSFEGNTFLGFRR